MAKEKTQQIHIRNCTVAACCCMLLKCSALGFRSLLRKFKRTLYEIQYMNVEIQRRCGVHLWKHAQNHRQGAVLWIFGPSEVASCSLVLVILVGTKRYETIDYLSITTSVVGAEEKVGQSSEKSAETTGSDPWRLLAFLPGESKGQTPFNDENGALFPHVLSL